MTAHRFNTGKYRPINPSRARDERKLVNGYPPPFLPGLDLSCSSKLSVETLAFVDA
jgi:hypothetical protein